MSRRDCPDCGGKGQVPTLDEASGLYFQTMCTGKGCGWRANGIGRVLLQVGDLLRLQDGPAVVVRTNDSGAYCTALQKRHVEVETRFGDKASFDRAGRHIIVSAHTEPYALVERRGEAWVDKFLAKKKNGSLPGQPVPTTEPEVGKEEENMSRQAAARGGLAAEAREMAAADAAPKKRGRKPKAEKADTNGHAEHKPKGLPDDEVKDFIKKFREKEPDAAPSKIVKALRETGKSCSIERLTKLAA